MSSINSVNGNGNNNNIAKVKQADTLQAMKDAAVASKEVVEKKVEKSVEVSKATISAAIKSDSVQISNEAKESDKAGYKAENKRDNRVSDGNSVKKNNVQATSSPRESIFTKKDNVKETPATKETVANSASDTHKPGMAQVDKNTQEDKKSSFGINRIGDYEDASGDFSDVSFMSSMSNNINEGLENYKEVKETTEDKDAKGTMDVNEAKQVNAEAEFSILA